MAAWVIPVVIAVAAAAAKTGEGLSTRTKVSKTDKQRLAELEGKDPGLTDEEIASARDIRLSPVQAQGRAAQRELAARMAAQDYSGGVAAKYQQALLETQNKSLESGLRDIAATDVKVKRAEEQEALDLERSLEAQKTARNQQTWAAIFGGVSEGLSTYAMSSKGTATQQATSEATRMAEMDALNEKLKVQIADYKEYEELMATIEAIP